MGLIRGSGSLTRYFVDGSIVDKDLKEIEKRIRRNSFKKLDEIGSEERSTGWVNILNIYDSSLEGRDYYIYPYIALSWRVDIRSVPKSALKQQVIEAEDEIKEREELEYIPKERKKELNEFLRQRLLKRAIPRIYTYDMIWNVETAMVMFGSTNNKLCDEFAEFFTRTFELNLTPVFPYSLGYRFFEGLEIDPNQLEGIKGSLFAEEK